MPYSSNSELPDPVKKALPEEAQTIFRGAFNGFMEGKPKSEEQNGFATAWATVKHKFKQDPKGNWVAKDSATMEMCDHVMIDAKDVVRTTADGYLVAMPRVARSGIQIYGGKEVGMPTMDKVKVYRPPEEVFSKDSMGTFAYRPITDDHPSEPVNAGNWKDYAVGSSGGEIARDGEYLRIPMIAMDAATIQKVKDGKAELSVGYTCDIEWDPGTDPNTGETYDAVQRSIRVNHIAIVKAARGGDKLKIGDQGKGPLDLSDKELARQQKENGNMELKDLKTVKVDGIECQMTDTAAQVVQKFITTHDDAAAEIKALKAKIAELEAQMAKEKKMEGDALATKDAEITTLKKQLADATLTPAQIDALVKDRGIVIAKAQAILGDKLVIDGKTDSEIQKQVVDAKLGDAAKDWKPEQVRASFDTLTSSIDLSKVGVQDTARALSNHRPGGAQTTKDTAYRTYEDSLTNRWKSPQDKAAAAN